MAFGRVATGARDGMAARAALLAFFATATAIRAHVVHPHMPRARVLHARPRVAIHGGAAAVPAGGDNLYRKFGISEDADYDEIVAAYERLCAKNADNKKELIRLEVAKDRILEDRLRRRMSGKLQSRVVESNWDRAQRLKPRKPVLDYLPPYLRRFIDVPKGDAFTNVAIFFGMLGGFALLLPAMASAVMMMGYLVSNGLLYNKGLPETKEDTGRPAELKPLLLTLAISTIVGGLGLSVGVGVAGLLFPDSTMAVSRRAAPPVRRLLLRACARTHACCPAFSLLPRA